MSDPRASAPPLSGLRVLVPRGGSVGERLADAVASAGGTPFVAPMIEVTEPTDSRPLSDALNRLAGGRYDWLAVTSASTVEALLHHSAQVPAITRVAAVGATTRAALEEAGFRVDFMPSAAFTAAAMVAEWPVHQGRVLIAQSAIAEPTLAQGLATLGLTVDAVTAYETVQLPVDASLRALLQGGSFDAVLATSGSIARAIAAHCVPLPGSTLLACIGTSTASAARQAGLVVNIVAEVSGAQELVDALGAHVTAQRPPARTHPEVTP